MAIDYLQLILVVPVIAGSVYEILRLLAMRRFQSGGPGQKAGAPGAYPPVTILKPVCGLDKGLEENLRSACLQDYPQFQVVISARDPHDPALPVMENVRREFPDRVDLAMENITAGLNGKINNLAGALLHARHDILVISDSDVRLKKDFLKSIVAPLAAREADNTGFVCTLYKAVSAGPWYEKMGLLTFNADFVPGIIFAYVTGAANFCLGSSVAFRRKDLESIGGIGSLSGYLTEDYEMGRRLLESGRKMALVPHLVEILVDLKSPAQWWTGQVCWDQKTKSANPAGFFSTIVTRSIPFAFLFAAIRADLPGLAVLATAVLVRIITAAAMLKGLGDREGLRALWLLPARDAAALFSWAAALVKKDVVWRGSRYGLDRYGKLARAE